MKHVLLGGPKSISFRGPLKGLKVISGAVDTAHQVFKVFDPAVAGATVDLSKTHAGAFVEKALAAN